MMEPDGTLPASGYRPGSPRERVISSLLSFAVIAIVVLAMIYQFVVSPQHEDSRRPVTFNVSGENTDKAAKDSQARPKAPKVATRSTERTDTPIRPPITVQKRIEKPDAFDGIPGFIRMSKTDLASSDIGKMKGPDQGSDADGKGRDARTAYGPGEGPGGVTLYRAQWYREPTDAEVASYLPRGGAMAGWADIACRTIEHYHVEDCQILAESPRGSGFGRAIQNAAWQFLVIPPRVGNKPKIGEWVRIHYEIVARDPS